MTETMPIEPRKAYQISLQESLRFIRSYRHEQLLSLPLENFPLDFRFLIRIYRNAWFAPRHTHLTVVQTMEAALRFHRSLRIELLGCNIDERSLRRQAFMRIHQLCMKYQIIHPELSFKMKGMSAGDAGNSKIRINPILFAENVEETLAQTIPHEMCHHWKEQLRLPGRAHGQEWKKLMRRMGVRPNRCHNLDVTRARVRTLRIYLYVCGCQREYRVTARKHNRIQETQLFRPVNCLRCRKEVRYVGTDQSLNQQATQGT